MARLLYLEETPIVEIQENKTNDDLFISLGNLELFYNREAKKLYQYQEWPSNKEIIEKQEAIKAIENEEEKEEKFQEFLKRTKDNSKKVVYNVLLKDKTTLVDFIEWLLKDNQVSKEYLD